MKRLGYTFGVLLAALAFAPLHAQETSGTVRGRVTDASTLTPIQGATVAIGSHSAVTQADGQFLITSVPAGTDTIHARMIGYSPVGRLVTLAAGQTIDVDLALTASAINLAELVVVGYGEQAAGNITGAVTAVSAQEFNPGRVVTPTELIQNKVAGVQVIENNEPGGRTSIRIRGATSTTASSDPLVVVDGVPLGAGGGVTTGRDPLNFINSNDIETITVLRDASAAAIYGANAANGVLLITTKRGSGTPRFEYTGSVSTSSVTRYPSMLNATQFRAAVTQYAPQNVAQLGTANTDWFAHVDQTAVGQEHNVALSGAGTSNSYRLSGNYLDQEGVIQGTKTQRVTLGVNYNQRLFEDRLNLRFSVRGSRAEEEFTPGGVLSNAAQMGPTQPVRDTSTVTDFFDWTGGIQSPDNPVAILTLAKNEGTTLRSVGNVQAGYTLPYIDGLTANVNLGYDVSKASRVSFDPSTLHAQIKNSNFGNYFRQDPTLLNSVFEPYLNYVVPRRLGPGQLDLTAGYSYSTSHAEFPTTSADSLATDLLGTDAIPAAKTINSTQFVQNSKFISFFGRANYNINDKYLLNFSLRRDGSSRFGPENQWGTFPSVAAAWRISEESFMPRIGGLSDLKLRASWAETGNQSFGDYLWSTSYTVGDAEAQYWMGNGFVTTIRPSAVDPDIKWEATRSFDVGMDFSFGTRLVGAIDWYDKKTTDMIFSVPAPSGTVPGDFITTNLGSMRNRGIEFSLSAEMLRGGSTGRGLQWHADFTAAHNTNELLTITPFGGTAQQILVGGIAGGVGSTIQVLKPGSPINSFLVYEQVYANGKPVEGSYKDQNGDGIINNNDLRPFEDPAPDWILGHSSYLSYGNFDMGFTLRAYLGNYVYNNVAANLGTYAEVTRGSPYNLHNSVLQTGFTTAQYFSDYYVEDASFLRMDNVTVGYTFNIRGQRARAFGTLQNAFTITGYDGVDPTAGLNGIDNNIYPRSRTLTGGLSLQF